MNRGRAELLAVVALIALAGCALPASPDEFDPDREPGQIGEFSHDDTFAFDDEPTLTEAQLEQLKYRSMARIEVVRDLQFEHDVELEIITRDEYREQRSGSPPASPFVDELWRGAFVVDGETDVNRALDDLYGATAQGYYTNDRIVVVTDAETDGIRIDRDTLVHELVHALQDQHFGLARDGETLDERRAELGLIEGEANYVPALYDERCGEEWQCLAAHEPAPGSETGTGTSIDEINVGLLLSIYAPYSEGPSFVAALHERGGWEAVDRAYGERPASTAQLIDPDRYPDDRPVEIDVPDRSTDDWEPVTDGDAVRTETVGEATLFATLWANGAIDRPIADGATGRSHYNYSAPETDGWTGDAFRVYRHADDADRQGHVWQLTWETDADAAEFADAYRALLENNEAETVTATTGEGPTYRIADEDPFAGAYRVTVTVADETVTIVGAPTVAALAEIHGETRSERAITSPPSPQTASTAVLEPDADPVSAPASASVPAPSSPSSSISASPSPSTSVSASPLPSSPLR